MRTARVAGVVSLIVIGLAGCSGGPSLEIPGLGGKVSEEEKIAKILDEVQKGMETRKVYQVMAHVSPNYMDQEGRDYEGIRAYLNEIMKNYREIIIRRSNPTILVEGDRARALDPFGTRADPDNNRVPPLNIQGQVSVYLEREDGKWKIVEWGPIS
jgi:hypothetical protein